MVNGYKLVCADELRRLLTTIIYSIAFSFFTRQHGLLVSSSQCFRLPIGSHVVGAFIMPCGSCFFCSKVTLLRYANLIVFLQSVIDCQWLNDCLGMW